MFSTNVVIFKFSVEVLDGDELLTTILPSIKAYLLFILIKALPKNSSLSLWATFDSVSASFPNRDMILISILIPRFLLEAECTRLSPYSGCLMPQLLKVFLKKNIYKEQLGQKCVKVHIFWEEHNILRNLPLTFDYSTYSQKYGEYFAKCCGLLRIYEL